MSGRLVSRGQRDRERGRPSLASASSNNQRKPRQATLPDYEPPSCPLDNQSRRALAELVSNHADTRKYEEQLKQSISLLTTSVSDINDRYEKRRTTLKRIQDRRRRQAEEGGEDANKKSERERAEETATVLLRETVPSLTQSCEAAVREVIDLRVELDDGRQAMQHTLHRAEEESINAAQRERDNVDDDTMEETKSTTLGPLRILKEEKKKAAEDYAAKSMEQRYAVDNDYIGFKRLWWDAAHGTDGKPLPDASRWFSRNDGEAEDEEDEEDDLVIAEEHVSIYCPLSMVIMNEPYTSRTCKHTFNKPAIVQFLQSQPNFMATCPLPGCDKEVSIKDFADDPVMLRKIERAKAERERRNAEDDGDDDEEEEEEEADVDGDTSMQETPSQSVKSERAKNRGRQLLANLGLGGGDGDEGED
ncbi:zinc-finger of the MIZ type in Nse subunit-domain-containing protein [Xylariaceae sp. FL1019]|nr:zinc-finger of the MIZ type in Nse subunit-domain-containing protein [Xylariaceae sp. FL1019]